MCWNTATLKLSLRALGQGMKIKYWDGAEKWIWSNYLTCTEEEISPGFNDGVILENFLCLRSCITEQHPLRWLWWHFIGSKVKIIMMNQQIHSSKMISLREKENIQAAIQKIWCRCSKGQLYPYFPLFNSFLRKRKLCPCFTSCVRWWH